MEQYVFNSNPKMPDDRVSFKTKQTPTWYINFAEATIAEAKSISDKTKEERLLNAANGIIDKNTFNYILQPYVDKDGENVLKDFSFPGDIRDTCIIKDILLKLLGEFATIPSHFTVVVNNSDYIYRKNAFLREAVYPVMQQALINKLNKEGINTGIETKEADIEKFVKEFKERYIDDRAIDGQDRLDALRDWTNDFDIYSQAYFYWLVLGKYFVVRDIVNNDILKRACNPYDCYPIRNGASYVSEYDGMVEETKMTITEVLDTFESELTKKDIEFLTKLRNEFSSEDGSIIVPYSVVKLLRTDYTFPEDSPDMTDRSFRVSTNSYVTVTRIQRKTSRKVGILTYANRLGQVFTKIVDEEYTFNSAGGDMNIKWVYIQYPIEMWKISGDIDREVALYTKPKWLPISPGIDSGLIKNSIGYSGKEGLFNINFNHSIVERLLTYEILDRIFRLALERIVYKEVLLHKIVLFPESLLAGGKIKPENKIFMVTADGILLYDDTDSSKHMAAQNGFRIVDQRTNNIIEVLLKLIQENKQDAWDAIGWNRQRDGLIFASDGKSTNESALQRSMMSTMFSYLVFNQARQKDYELDLEYTKITDINYTKEDSIGMFTNSEGKIKTLNIDGLQHAEAEYGIHCVNSAEELAKLKQLESIAFSASQNGDWEVAIEAISSNNTAKIKERLLKFAEVLREREEAKQALDRESAERIQAMISKDKQAEIKAENDRIIYKGEIELEKARIAAEASKDSPAPIEHHTNTTLANAKLALQERALNIQEEKMKQQLLLNKAKNNKTK